MNSPAIFEVFIYLCISEPEKGLEFYSEVFGAKELFRLTKPDGEIAHAEIKIGPATIMLSGEYPDYGIRSPQHYGGTGTTIHLHIDNVDEMAKKAEAAGAEILIEPNDQPHGERQCRFRDPFGHEWLLGHELEKLSPEEMQRKFDESFND